MDKFIGFDVDHKHTVACITAGIRSTDTGHRKNLVLLETHGVDAGSLLPVRRPSGRH
jgi:hypothetical protein